MKILTESEYLAKRAICDKADAYHKANATFHTSGWATLSAELAEHPDYATCTNEIRGEVEQYELLTNPPEKLTAYIGKPNLNGMGVDRSVGQTYPITVWTGAQIGFATKGKEWRVYSAYGHTMAMFYARIAGREYVGRGFGEGMAINLRETAKSKRERL
jgi:hypothetical protein